MNHNTELLSLIHKNAAMGVTTIPTAMALPQSRAMTHALDTQLNEYLNITATCQSVANSHGKKLSGPNLAARTMSDTMLKMHAAMDPSTSKLAEMMIQGSTMGTVQMTRRLHQYRGEVDHKIFDLGQRLLRTEERNIQEMKRYL